MLNLKQDIANVIRKCSPTVTKQTGHAKHLFPEGTGVGFSVNKGSFILSTTNQDKVTTVALIKNIMIL